MGLVELTFKDKLKTVSRLWLYLLKYYFRIEVEGIENIPKKGPAVITPNHSGFAGADAVLLTFIIKRETRRRARLLAHRAYFDYSEKLKELSESHGLKRASVDSGIQTLKDGRLLIVFPEGEAGNFKSSLKRYELQPFHTGYLRMAAPAQAPIIPCLIVGAEESNLSLGNLDFSKVIKNLRIPIPLNLMPLPAKWRIVFLPPAETKDLTPEILKQKRKLKAEASKLQKKMQKELERRQKARPYIYSKQTRKLANQALGLFKRALGND